MQKINDDAPHSVVYWLRWEIHNKLPNGKLSGTPRDAKDYRGVLHCENRIEAKETIEEIIKYLSEYLEQCQQKLQSNVQTNSNQQA